METTHRIVTGDSRSLSRVETDSVELVVTSPPYPMIEMWDGVFSDLDPEIADLLEAGKGKAAFSRMHEKLAKVWNEVRRVLVDGGIACINIGDATRNIDGSFRVFQNRSRIVNAFTDLGFEPLPEILWRKPVNSGAKFMGSGMLPPNAYVTLEHEYVLVFRNGKDSRSFEPGSERRYNSAYFWEERNQWFSDVWTEIKGELQALEQRDLRERSAAYPFEIPYRLISMYSVYGDTVLDPFWGTGTTSIAAMVAGRNSVGYELDESFVELFEERVADVPEYSRTVIKQRLADHEAFVEERLAEGGDFKYQADNYDFPVITKQEKPLQFYSVSDIQEIDGGYRASHEPVEDTDIQITEPKQGGETASRSDL
ncbi:site-specific DNA-methyltransferase [Halorubrum sp. CBA1125]|uniref:DNA-methyltransferase n=1 Tax=Halorubrum sp. CBA1125 TaxID=2668072 RepID=UPI0012E79854|nr:site-specific DNA-methyltransferase [Halorubrum sp. CBA1125]MUW14386.1 site-specific DNA-methyltransferase [Halorubrum sp. CBA1125]